MKLDGGKTRNSRAFESCSLGFATAWCACLSLVQLSMGLINRQHFCCAGRITQGGIFFPPTSKFISSPYFPVLSLYGKYLSYYVITYLVLFMWLLKKKKNLLIFSRFFPSLFFLPFCLYTWRFFCSLSLSLLPSIFFLFCTTCW